MSREQSQSVTSQTLSPSEAFAQQPQIKRLIALVVTSTNDRSDQIIAAAMHMKELRERFETNRDAIECTWYEWAFAHLKTKDRNVLALMQRVSEAKTRKAQEAIIRVFWRGGAQRQKKFRAKKKSEVEGLEAERTALMNWATKASFEEVKEALAFVSETFPITSTP